MKDKIETVLAGLFGGIFILLSVIVTVETVSRRLFSLSLQGADELGGYALAVGATIAFSMALLGRNHIRVDVLHGFFPPRLQAFLNWLSIVMLASFAVFLAWTSYKVIGDTLLYRSTAPTPWATPLVYPQAVWLVCIGVFALMSTAFAVHATWLFLSQRIDQLNRDYNPKSAKDELKEELDDIAQRNAPQSGGAS
jgi:TRAP-type C4-dicarboxylate transport system permease small subunit